MNNTDIYSYLSKIGCLTFSTSNGQEIHSRIAHFFACDEQGFYFRTMKIKPFYRQLKAHGQLTVCGQYPSAQLVSQDQNGVPFFMPGYTLRIIGQAHELTPEDILQKYAVNPDFRILIHDQEVYPATQGFCLSKGKGELYDYDYEMKKRDHKLLRTRFGFGGQSFNASGSRISEACIGCGRCEKVCTFKAIIPNGKQFQIIPERCDECGSCINTCPQKAILEPLEI